MHIDSDDKALLSEINVTPFVDVMLVLLIIFMVTAPMMVQGVDVSLPAASSAPIPADMDKLIISVDENHNIFINNQEVTIEFLKDKLSAVMENLGSRRVYLRADKRIPYGTVVRVISEIKKAGVDSLGMITLPEEDKGS